ncbi:MAG TPA: SNF2 helicase-associated domain-containing protein, partial [Phycisphaerales bacterium]|nr:SNF2 helicase-associated domain-containing protein [Phycisphaerales bacterium]
MRIVLHANWSAKHLHLWAEDARLGAELRHQTSNSQSADAAPATDRHPFAVPADVLQSLLASLIGSNIRMSPGELILRLPFDRSSPAVPLPSARLRHLLGMEATLSDGSTSELRPTAVNTVRLDPIDITEALERLIEADSQASGSFDAASLGPGIEYFATAGRLARHLLAQQRFVPMLRQRSGGELLGVWQPWTADESTSRKRDVLIRSMPAAVRAVQDEFAHDAAAIFDDFLSSLCDARCRSIFKHEDLMDAVREREAASDPHVAWLKGLLADAQAVEVSTAVRQDMTRRVRTWIAGLEERGQSSLWRLCLRLNEPIESRIGLADGATEADAVWSVSFHLQAVEHPGVVIDASDIWLLTAPAIVLSGQRLDNPQELLLAELGRASRLYKRLEAALEESEPIELTLNTKQAYEFLREVRPILLEQGFGSQAPEWWESPAARLGARLRLESDAVPPSERSAG